MLTTPVFWPEEFHGLYSPWDYKESNITDFFQKGQDQEVSDAWVNAKVFIFYGLLEWFS